MISKEKIEIHKYNIIVYKYLGNDDYLEHDRIHWHCIGGCPEYYALFWFWNYKYYDDVKRKQHKEKFKIIDVKHFDEDSDWSNFEKEYLDSLHNS